MLVFSGLGFADEHFPFSGEIKRGPVNVRAGANPNFESVAKLVQGAQVVVLGKSYQWYKIQLPSTAMAFIRADYLVERGGGVGVLTGDKVNVRAKPNSESSVLGQLRKGDSVKLLEKMNNWYKVEPPAGTVGWVHADFVRAKALQVPDLRKPLIAGVIPTPVVVHEQGYLLPLTGAADVDVHYQIVVNGKPAYYVQDAPHLEHFSHTQVNFEGSLVPGGKTTACPVLRIKKITLIL